MFRNSVARLLSKDGVASLTQSLQLSRGGISGPSVNSGTVVTAARRRGFASAQEGGEAAAEAGAKPESIINWVVPAIGVPGLVGWFIYQKYSDWEQSKELDEVYAGLDYRRRR